MTVRKNIIAGWMAHLITVAIGFFLMPYILGTVGEAQYGAWLFINAIAGYSGLIYSGFGQTICRFVADLHARKDWSRLNAVVSTIQVVYMGTAALVLLFTLGVSWMAPGMKTWDALPMNEVQTAILIVGGTIGLGMIGSVYGGVLIGAQRIDIQRGIEVAVGLVRLVLTITCLHQQYGLVTLSLIFFVTTLVDHGLSAFFAYRTVPGLSVVPWKMRKNVLAECFGFSTFNALSLAAHYLIYFTDTIVIGLILGPVAVVPYQIGLRIAQMIQIPIAQIGEAVLPRAGELNVTHSRGELGRLVTKCMGLAVLLACGFFIGAGYFGHLLIETWIGTAYPASALVLTILVGAQVVSLPMEVVRKTLVGIGDVRRPACFHLLEAGINLGLSLLLIRWWGIIGVAWGTLIPLVMVELFLLWPYAARRLSISRGTLLEEVLFPQVPALIGLLLFCEVASRLVHSPGWAPVMAVTIGGGAVLLGVRYLTHRCLQNDAQLRMTLPVPSGGQTETLTG